MPNPSDEIKSKLDIVEVIREYIPLKAAGYNFRANCPFHREKTPSFMVSPEKQIWHCFGCGKGGDVFSFVMEIEGLSFVEVLRLLAKKAGVALKRANPELASKRNVLLDILEASAKFYHKVLLDSPATEAARAYLQKRALTADTIDAWQIGYSPNSWETLGNFLKGRGFGENEIFLAGMSVKKEKAPGFYDRFRDRIMFPIADLSGNVVGFSARVVPVGQADGPEAGAAKMGKYINSPATMVYDKSKIIFGLDKAKMAIKAEDAAVLVEGQMDCITAQQNGFKNVIASSGTALTAEQAGLIKRYSNNLFLSFDMDRAGEMAAERGIAVAMRAEMQIKVIEIKGAKDPDECIRQNPENWRLAVTAAKPMMQYYFDKTFAKFNKADYEGQRQSLKELLPIIAKFFSKIEQDFWLKKLSQELDAKENFLREKLEEIMTAAIKAAEKNEKLPVRSGAPGEQARPPLREELKPSRESRLSELLLALILRYPTHLEYAINHLSPNDLAGSGHVLLYKNLIIYYNKLIDFWTNQGGNFDLTLNYQDLKEWFSHPENLMSDSQAGNENISQADCLNCSSLLDKLVLLADRDFYDYKEEQVKAEIIGLVAKLRLGGLSRRLQQVAKVIALTEKENIPPEQKTEKLKTCLEEFRSLNEEIKLLEIK